jgi:beta-glucosidase
MKMSEAEASENAPEGDGTPEVAMGPDEAAPVGEGIVALDGVQRFAGRIAILFVVGTAAAMLIGLALSLVRGPQGPWRGEYYENTDFEGDATIRYARKIEFDWKKGAPFSGMPKDQFSVIWTTCMEIEETTEVRFRVSSDDGTRLYVDDELLIDNWGAHATRTRTGKIELEPGVYYLRLDYFEERHGSNVKLEAAMDDGEAEAISPDILRQPDDDENDPCG